jgi:hypothetical protein
LHAAVIISKRICSSSRLDRKHESKIRLPRVVVVLVNAMPLLSLHAARWAAKAAVILILSWGQDKRQSFPPALREFSSCSSHFHRFIY